ncbi:MAG: exodeoxyribonuclease VII large subunit [Paludibacteraceae bacterium]|nr:exodeoxyribonuclease VII large subunit [Paludibacteraceae bacterium]
MAPLEHTAHRTLYTLTELCSLIGEALDDSLASSYWVKAEISSLSVKGGHMYLDLVDNQQSKIASKMRATCWSGTQEMLMAYFESETGQRLQVGMSVLVEVEVQYHPVYGLSLSIVGIDPSYTVGDIAQQRQRTIAALRADGLLDAQQLLPLPTLIRRIAVVSSPNAAGYEDFKHQLDNSPYRFETQLFGATMQGEGAAKSIIAALEEISKENNPSLQGGAGVGSPYDAVAIIRGGGATTDLSCFDNYELCAVCAQFELPVISGIGHTRDVSILDLVAHEALKTPTAVAEWLIHRMDAQLERIAELTVRLRRTAERQILIRQHRVELLEQRLAARNPERIYRMGYSLLTKNGKVIRSVHDLQPGDQIETHLIDGNVLSAVL